MIDWSPLSCHAVRVHHPSSRTLLAISPSIFIQTFRAARQAKAAQDGILVAVLRDAARTFWTRTVWKDEAAMRA